MAARLITAVEAVVHAEAEITAEGGKADGFLILLVEEVGDAAVERDAAAEVVAGGEIEAGVSRIAGEARAGTNVPDVEAVKIAVGAHAGEIAGKVEIDTAEGGVEPEVAGAHWAAKEMIARLLEGTGSSDCFQHAGVVVGVVSFQDEPVIEMRFTGPIEAASAGGIDIEEELFAAAETDGIGRPLLLVDQIVKLVGKKGSGNTEAIGAEILIDSGVDGAAALGAQIGIAGVARIGVEGFEDGGFLDALAIRNSGAGVSQKALGIAERVDGASAGHNACAEICIFFGASARAESETGERLPAGVEEAGLIIAARVEAAEIVGVGVFHFVLISGGDRALAEGIRGLFEEAGAIELGGFKKVEIGKAVGVDEARFHARDAVDPVGTGFEGPAKIAGKLTFIVEGRGVQRKNSSEESLAGSAGVTGVAAYGEAELIRIGEAIADVAGEAAVQEGVVDALAVGMKVGAGDGVVEFVDESADLGSAASRRKA